MSYGNLLSNHSIAISISESPDMAALGLSDGHLCDAMTEITRYLLALGANLVYGGDLRSYGFSELLFELVARYSANLDKNEVLPRVTDYLAWPVHIGISDDELKKFEVALGGTARLVCLDLDGKPLVERKSSEKLMPSDEQWARGLTAMRKSMLEQTHARIVLGGKIQDYKGIMPGIAEEALLSLEQQQALYVLGGFGGCARDIAEGIFSLDPLWPEARRTGGVRAKFVDFRSDHLCNGLEFEENKKLAVTQSISEAIELILTGINRLKEK